jgi:hypothetical protein
MYKITEGSIVTFKNPHEIQCEYGTLNKDGWIQVGSQSYGTEMYDAYKNCLYVVKRIEGDRVIFYDNTSKVPWQRITTGMVKRVLKLK